MVRGLNKLDCRVQVSTIKLDSKELILPLGRHTSVFQAEVYALLYCARLENLVNMNNSSTAICCDSLAAINVVSAFKATTGLVADAMKALKSLFYNYNF